MGENALIGRYIDSALVYQEIRGKLPIDKLVKIWQNTISISYPDLTFVLDVAPNQVSIERVNKRRQEAREKPNN